MSDGRPAGGGCLKILGGSCLALLLLALVGGVAIWVSRDLILGSRWFGSIRETVETAQSEVARMQELQKSLLADYPSKEIGVQGSFNSRNGTTTRTLIVRFLNPGFGLPEAAEAQREAVQRIARTIAARYPGLGRYQQLRIVVETDGGGLAGYGAVTTFEFPVADLPAGEAAR